MFSIIIIFSSCIPIGDSGFKVKGNIIQADRKPINKYVLELYLADNDQLLSSEEIGTSFETSFIIAPQRLKYYMVLRTSDGKLRYKTKIYELGSNVHYKNPINLGKIHLKKAK